MLHKILSLTLLTLFPFAAQSQSGRWESNHLWEGGMFSAWMMWLWMAIFVFFAVWVIKYASGRNNVGRAVRIDDTALTALQIRLANGENSEKEYQAIKKTLEF